MTINLLRTLYILPFFLCLTASAQVLCPNNINFEQGTLSNWQCAISTNNGTSAYVWTNVSPLLNRQDIMSGSGNDQYGNFPVVAPGGGLYSLKLGNDQTGREMDRARYTLQVPAGTNNFNLVYRYAVVFQDGNHQPNEQPFFQVAVTDSATGHPISCNFSTYISNSNLPGFVETSPGSNLWYKDWTAATLRIANMGGHTVYVEFIASDCSLGGHFGYGYVDLNCDGYSLSTANCNGAITTPLTGPFGFSHYSWYDSSYSTLIGTGQTVYVPAPATSNYYNLVLTPFAGYGCIDTLSTRVAYANLAATASPDTSFLCGFGATARLNVAAVGTAPPYTYRWGPVTGLSCTNCATPDASPTTNTAYIVTVTDSVGCVVKDTVMVNTGVVLAISKTDINCYGANNGTASVTPTGGKSPYVYVWNNNSSLNTPTISNLGPGVYSVSVKDANNCTATGSVSVVQAPPLVVTSSSTNVTCAGASNGTATAVASGGTGTLRYSWNTTPPQLTAAITNLGPGTYISTITDSNGCTATTTRTITQPTPLVATTSILAQPCAGLSTGILSVKATGGTPPYQYYWNSGIFQARDTVRNIAAGTYLVQTTDANGCTFSSTVVLNPYPLPQVTAGFDASICAGDTTVLTANGANRFRWQPADWLGCDTCAQTKAYPDSTKIFYLTGTDNHGCVNADTVVVTVIQKVPVGVDTTRYICPGERVALGAFGGESYVWSPANSLDGPQFANPIASPDSTTTYQVIITQNRCFQDTLEEKVVVKPKPSIRLGADFYGIPGATVNLPTQVTDAMIIEWTPRAGLSCTDCYEPTASLDTSITYIAEVTNSYGCKARDTINIFVGCDGSAFFMANTFTPNHDGQNDYFYPQGLGVNTVKRFMIYDRWGEIVFSAADIPANVEERGWNGMFRNKELPPDVFLYVVETICKDGNPIVLKGDVTLVR